MEKVDAKLLRWAAGGLQSSLQSWGRWVRAAGRKLHRGTRPWQHHPHSGTETCREVSLTWDAGPGELAVFTKGPAIRPVCPQPASDWGLCGPHTPASGEGLLSACLHRRVKRRGWKQRRGYLPLHSPFWAEAWLPSKVGPALPGTLPALTSVRKTSCTPSPGAPPFLRRISFDRAFCSPYHQIPSLLRPGEQGMLWTVALLVAVLSPGKQVA